MTDKFCKAKYARAEDLRKLSDQFYKFRTNEFAHLSYRVWFILGVLSVIGGLLVAILQKL